MSKFQQISRVIAGTAIGLWASTAMAASLGPSKASQLVYSTYFTASNVLDPCAGAVEIELNQEPEAGEALVVTGLSWTMGGATPNTRVQVVLKRGDGNGNFIGGVHATAMANASGEVVGSVSLQPGVVALQPADGYTYLCLGKTTSGTIGSEGSVTGYITKDK